jgi:hypothetical protein
MKARSRLIPLTLGFILAGCGSNKLSCDSSGARDLVTKILHEHQPITLLGTAFSDNLAKLYSGEHDYQHSLRDCETSAHANETVNECADRLDRANVEMINKRTNDAYNSAIYSLSAIRLESQDADTGAVTCDATLQVTIPNSGSAQQDITYKVEKTTNDQLYVTVGGLQ